MRGQFDNPNIKPKSRFFSDGACDFSSHCHLAWFTVPGGMTSEVFRDHAHIVTRQRSFLNRGRGMGWKSQRTVWLTPGTGIVKEGALRRSSHVFRWAEPFGGNAQRLLLNWFSSSPSHWELSCLPVKINMNPNALLSWFYWNTPGEVMGCFTSICFEGVFFLPYLNEIQLTTEYT